MSSTIKEYLKQKPVLGYIPVHIKDLVRWEKELDGEIETTSKVARQAVKDEEVLKKKIEKLETGISVSIITLDRIDRNQLVREELESLLMAV